MTIYIGIDPGLTGAIAFLDETGRVFEVHDMPVGAKPRGKGSMVDVASLVAVFGLDWEVGWAAVEFVHAMPKQGVSSTFSLGDSFGCVRAALASAGIPVVYISPGEWKRRAGLTGKDKDASRMLALERHPEAAEWLQRKKDHGRAEAILIADDLRNEVFR